MAHVSDLIAEDIGAYLKQHEHKSLLRFITCGSVDDGKSTLIGRLLYESKMLFEDQLAALEADSKKVGTQGGDLDFALLVDGLSAEREQGITIDVAYRFFSTDRRKFIVADTPGHEQYTRNMVTGASTADLAIILVDARHGVQTQTRRHSFLVSLIGIRRVVVAINKMDLVGFSQDVYDRIERDYRTFAAQIGLNDILCIPMSALRGDNITDKSDRTPWYAGPTLMEHLETVPIDDIQTSGPFRLPVQWVNRPNLDFRGFSGLIASGTVRPGDRIRVQPSGRDSTVERIVVSGGDLPEAVAGQSVTLTLTDEIDCSRGDVIVAAAQPSGAGDSFDATLVWMSDEALATGRSYLMKSGTRTVGATINAIEYRVNVNTMERGEAAALALNEIGRVALVTDRLIAFDPYETVHDTGSFILIDRLSNNTVGAGLLHGARSKPRDLGWTQLGTGRAERAALKQQSPLLLWAGEGVDACRLEQKLMSIGRHTIVLPAATADFLRIAGILLDAGLIVVVDADSGQPPSLGAVVPAGERVEVRVVSGQGQPLLDVDGSMLTISSSTQEEEVEQIVETLRRAGRLS
ncbi:sulfate adenylyltransferase subunit CysN [Methyloversatilis sp. XJ19-49]|uniref:sulfate adenylyltransferase subunit CysN n=1 Tax=Methyloversatilis sp. XJ19-49 TaxID=2963429 RepID=UPI00211CB652|nr:sulfate adenylyltransferase subunit CysN [Methyloversatilis sp. XJ19-49]MCQ9378586.1 sulfate adenylyltransferase subunit CysN [Methyloversatilis sp. XJ19-49]